MKIIKLLLLLLLVFAIDATDATAEEKESAANKGEQSFQVKLPDGLYLFQPKLHESRFSPLFIIKGGKLIDPYPLAKKIGIPKFMKKYVTGKTFNVYVGTEMIGKLSDVKLDFINGCVSSEFLPDIQGRGVYKGKPLPSMRIDSSVYVHNLEFFLPLGSFKAVATPQSFLSSKKIEVFSVTEEDKIKAVEAIRTNFISEVMDRINMSLKSLYSEKRVILGEEGSKLEFIKAIDIDGNGMKDLVGGYDFTVRHNKEAMPTEQQGGLIGIDIFFILWDSGKIEKILYGDTMRPDFVVGGLIDMDLDGIQELIVQPRFSPTGAYENDVYESDGESIEIFRDATSGWNSIYSSMGICRRSY